MSVNSKYTRRALMSRLGGATACSALAPFVPILETDAQQGSITRYLPWYTPIFPNSGLVARWMPDSQGNLQWRNETAELNPMASKMSLIRGLGNIAGNISGRGRNKFAGGHKPSGITMITGREVAKGRSGTKLEGGYSLGPHDSLDVWMGKEMVKKGVGVKRPYMLFGHLNKGLKGDPAWTSVSFDNGQILQRHQSPKSLYDEMVKFAGGPTTSTRPDGKIAAYGFVQEEIKRLQKRLGADDARKMDSHLNEVSELEKALNKMGENGGGGAGSCNLSGVDTNVELRHDTILPVYMQLVKLAFNCDITRVMGAMYFSHLWGRGMEFLPGGHGDYHKATHDGGNANNNFINQVMKYRCKMFVELMKTLDSVDEGNGKSMLDNTIIHWYTDVSRNHDWHDQFNVIAGGGNYFKMGVCNIVGAPGKKPSDGGGASSNTSYNQNPQNKLLVSIARAMGFQIDKFGNYGNGGLPGNVLL